MREEKKTKIVLHDSHGVPLSMDVIETHGDDTFS